MLIVVKDRNVELVSQLLLDGEAARRRNVFEVDAAESWSDRLDGSHDFVGILDVEAYRKCIDAAKLLEQHRLAFHHRHRRERSDVAEAKHSRAVRDDGNRVFFDSERERLLRILMNGLAH